MSGESDDSRTSASPEGAARPQGDSTLPYEPKPKRHLPAIPERERFSKGACGLTVGLGVLAVVAAWTLFSGSLRTDLTVVGAAVAATGLFIAMMNLPDWYSRGDE